jgi:hypothetical protein
MLSYSEQKRSKGEGGGCRNNPIGSSGSLSNALEKLVESDESAGKKQGTSPNVKDAHLSPLRARFSGRSIALGSNTQELFLFLDGLGLCDLD